MEVTEFGIERHKTYELGESAEGTDSRAMLIEISVRIRVCFSVESVCRLLNLRGANVDF